jgi:hypothetical protein
MRSNVDPVKKAKEEVKLKPPVVVWESTNYRIIAKANEDMPYYPGRASSKVIKTAYILEHVHMNSLREKNWVVCTDTGKVTHLTCMIQELASASGKVPESWIEPNKPRTKGPLPTTGHPYR